MSTTVDRRTFLASLGVTVGAVTLGDVTAPAAQESSRGRVPDTAVKFGHITILSGPGGVLGAPSLQGHTLASEEINAAGGVLRRRKIEKITADEAAGADASAGEGKRVKAPWEKGLF